MPKAFPPLLFCLVQILYGLGANLSCPADDLRGFLPDGTVPEPAQLPIVLPVEARFIKPYQPPTPRDR